MRPWPRRPAPRGRKIRLAYLSAFFGARNWMKPVFGVINRHDRAHFEIHLVSDGDDPSPAFVNGILDAVARDVRESQA